MAAGDVQASITSVAASGTLDIKPSSGVEWVIHNIQWNQGSIELYRTDGTNLLKFDTDTSMGGRLGVTFHVTNTQWIQVKNTAATATLIGYDGIQTK